MLCDSVLKALGKERRQLKNVELIENTPNMAPIYAEIKILLALSVWWESFAKVVTEAQLNRIPCVVSDSGGLPEAVGGGGSVVSIPLDCRNPLYNKLPGQHFLNGLKLRIENYYDDPDYYKSKSITKSRSITALDHQLIFHPANIIAKYDFSLSELVTNG